MIGCHAGQVGRLWTSLADYYIRRGLIEKARDVYEEGLTTVTTVRDFSLIFDTLTQVCHKLWPNLQCVMTWRDLNVFVYFLAC